MILYSLIIFPLLGILGLCTTDNPKSILRLSLLTTIITFFTSIVLWVKYDSITGGFQYVTQLEDIYFSKIVLGVDGLSLFFVLLNCVIFPICVLISWRNVEINKKIFMIILLLLEALLNTVFLVTDLLLFYIFFESVLMPLFLLIGLWGSSDDRIRAGYLLFLYTLFGSLFILLALITMNSHVGSLDMTNINWAQISVDRQSALWLAIFFSIAIKQPLVPFNIWLNRAHAEAPLAGSVILAALILKLATYGILRILIPYIPECSTLLSPIAGFIAIITIIYSSMSTIRQNDIKIIVAYSSVAHISLVLAGLISNTFQGIEGSIILSLAHGFTSSALFISVGGVLYERFHTRIISYLRGFSQTMPLFSFIFFVFILGNIGTPLTANFIGEFIALIGAFISNPVLGVLLASGIVLSACYSIWLWARVCNGEYNKLLTYHIDLTRREYLSLLPLLIAGLLFGVLPNLIYTDIEFNVSMLLSYLAA